MKGSERRGLPRTLEVAIALCVLTAAAPVLAVAAVAVWINSPGPVLFRHERVGRAGRKFLLLKIRSMRPLEGPKLTASGDVRIFAVGRVLRTLKLDELPGFWNVVRGEMRLVGPRPEVADHVDLSNAQWREVLQDAPGLTDPVTRLLRHEEALLGNAGENWEEFYTKTLQPLKLAGYIHYQRTRTWHTDIRVLAGTVGAILKLKQPPQSTDEMLKALALVSGQETS